MYVCVGVCVVKGVEGARQQEMDGWCVSCRQTADRPARGILQGVWNSHSLSVYPAAKHKRVYVYARTHTHAHKVVLLPLPLASNLWDILQPFPPLPL